MFGYVTLLAAQPLLVCMLGFNQLLSCYLLGLGYHLIIIVVDDMIIIMLTIFDEGWKV